ncbi:hypothetical protein RRG08_025923 [Elysia crispata]|uniref:Uncharacterized protein n=1 Tax=Elysia crispata TaxID=231223 RepID=A0AAE1DPD9_9GAST|nr:hypothetical protein RRG08_025923 [Elysia crispata]
MNSAFTPVSPPSFPPCQAAESPVCCEDLSPTSFSRYSFIEPSSPRPSIPPAAGARESKCKQLFESYSSSKFASRFALSVSRAGSLGRGRFIVAHRIQAGKLVVWSRVL